MAYRFKCTETVEQAVHRIAGEQLDRAIAKVEEDTANRNQVVHDVRKRCKKIRGLLRLVRPQLGSLYATENKRFRDMARELAPLRDAVATVEVAGELRLEQEGKEYHRLLANLEEELAQRQKHRAAAGEEIEARLSDFLDSAEAARESVGNWTVKEEGFPAVRGGLEKTYRRGRKALTHAYREKSGEAFHDWRKRAKYHWYHVRLLRNVWKPILRERADEIHRLTELLGREHDLTVIQEIVVCPHTEIMDDEESRHRLLEFLRERREKARADAWPLGRRLFAEKPKRLCNRMEVYWQTWRE